MSLSKIVADSIATNTVTVTNIADNTITSAKLTTTGVVANQYGHSTGIPVVTVDSTGRVSNVTVANTQPHHDTAYANAVSDATNLAANAYANAVTVATNLAANAYANAVSDATNLAANAYANAVSDATNLAANAYANAISVANTTSFNQAANAYANVFNGGTFTGVTTFTANITGNNVSINGSLQIDGDLTVGGNVVTINTTNLEVDDNMIYLNANSAVSNPDLGIAGNYNDGTYRHAGIFRDATDGVWKFFHQYEPEPDASAYIDTANNTFALANVQANYFIGTLSGDASSVGGNTASTLRSYSDTMAGTAYSNAVSSAASTYLPLTGGTLSGNLNVNSAKLQVVQSTPTGLGTLPSGTTSIMDSGGNNYLVFRNTADNGTYGGIAFQDNNIGGYVIFGNAGGGGDLLYVAGYGGGQLQQGTSDSINPGARTTIASWNSTGLQINSGDLRAPIMYDSNNTGYYVDPASTTRLNRLYLDARNDNYYVGSMNSTGAVSDWQSLTNTTGQWTVTQFNNISNYTNSPGSVYTYGAVMSWRTENHSFQLYAAHTGDLAYKTQWNNDNYSGWLYPVVYGRSAGASSIYGTILYDSNDTGYYVDPNSSAYNCARFAGGIHVSLGNTTGQGIVLADDGDIVDLNDGYCAMRFTYGVRIFSANRGGSAVITLNNGGNIYAAAYYYNSDQRLKTNIKGLNNSLSTICKLNPVSFDWIKDNKSDIGFIAQDVKEHIEEAVSVSENDNETLTLNHNAILAHAVKAIQELTSKVEELEAKLSNFGIQ